MISTFATGLFVGAEEHAIDETHHWLLPETAEIIYGSIAFALVVALFWKFGIHKMIGKALNARTERVQKELDDSAAARSGAEIEAAQIRRAAGDIQSERTRLLAEADAQAEQMLADGRVRIDNEAAELEARAEAEIASATSRSGDELRGEIGRLSAAAAEKVVTDSLDDTTLQDLIENYIANVGATGKA